MFITTSSRQIIELTARATLDLLMESEYKNILPFKGSDNGVFLPVIAVSSHGKIYLMVDFVDFHAGAIELNPDIIFSMLRKSKKYRDKLPIISEQFRAVAAISSRGTVWLTHEQKEEYR